LPPEELETHLRQYGIKCVVSVRGTSEREDWLRGEERVCQDNHCAFAGYDLHLGVLSPPKELNGLVARLEEGPYPLLLHCRNGADRSGLASVLYLMVVEGQSLDDALAAQLSWRFGHFKAGKAQVIDEFFELYRNTSQGRDIKTWLAEMYPQLYAQQKKPAARSPQPEKRNQNQPWRATARRGAPRLPVSLP